MSATTNSPRPRWPLTGQLRIEFVDAADPDDAAVAPNWGGGIRGCEPESWLDDKRLPSLLRWLADWIEEGQEEDEQP